MSYKRISGMPVIEGGTGRITLTTAYGVLCAGTTATGAVQTLAALGASGTVLTSNGAGALPSFQAVSGGVTSVTGTANQITVTGTTAVTLSIPSVFIAPGSIEATTSVTADTVFNTPTTTSTVGQYRINGSAVLHTFGTGLGNTFVGLGAGNFTLTTSEHNTAIGSLAGASLAGTTGHNTYLGYQAGTLDDGAGGTNTAVGHASFSAFTGATVARNTCLGGDSLLLLVSGRRNLALGYSAGSALTTNDSDNIIIGSNTTGTAGNNNQLIIGSGTGTGTSQINKATICGIYSKANSGTQNLAVIDSNNVIGSSTSTSITGSLTLTDFVSTGTNVQLPTTSSSAGNIQWNGATLIHAYGTSNIWIGDGAGNYTLTTATAKFNQGIGTSTLAATTTGTFNTAIGYQAGKAVTTGSNNVYIGNNVAQVTTTQGDNVVIGDSAGIALTTGTGSNVFIGGSAGGQITTGNTNTLIGIACGFNLTGTDGQNIFIGQTRGSAGDNTKTRIGFSTSNAAKQTTCFIDGIQNATTTGSAVVVNASGQLAPVASSIKFKENVSDMGDYSSDIFKLRPVTFTYRKETCDDQSMQGGLIAEEVLKVMPQLVFNNSYGEVHSVKYQDLAALLLNELQKAIKRIDILEAALNIFKKE